jgi:hypothetical protein
VGQDLYEEIDYQPVMSTGGENYGWNIMEGFHCYNATSCSQTSFTLPVAEYDHSQERALTAGRCTGARFTRRSMECFCMEVFACFLLFHRITSPLLAPEVFDLKRAALHTFVLLFPPLSHDFLRLQPVVHVESVSASPLLIEFVRNIRYVFIIVEFFQETPS